MTQKSACFLLSLTSKDMPTLAKHWQNPQHLPQRCLPQNCSFLDEARGDNKRKYFFFGLSDVDPPPPHYRPPVMEAKQNGICVLSYPGAWGKGGGGGSSLDQLTVDSTSSHVCVYSVVQVENTWRAVRYV